MLQKSIGALALLTLLCTPAWAINKCTGPDGKTTYQEEPCANGANTTTIQKVATANTSEERERQATQACAIGPLPQFPAVGWTEEKFQNCSLISLRETPKINTSENAQGISKQYVFRYYRAYVYVRGGRVTTIQH